MLKVTTTKNYKLLIKTNTTRLILYWNIFLNNIFKKVCVYIQKEYEYQNFLVLKQNT